LATAVVLVVGSSPASAATSGPEILAPHATDAVGASPNVLAATTRIRADDALSEAPSGSVRLGTLLDTTPLSVDVMLRPRNAAQLDAFVQAVSNPQSPDYEHYLLPGQFAAQYGAAPATIQATRIWLEREGLHPRAVSANHLVVSVAATAGHLEQALGVGLYRYRLPGGQHVFAPSGALLVPQGLSGDIQAVLGLDDLAQPQALSLDAPASGEWRAATASSVPGSAHSATLVGHETNPAPCVGASQVGGYTANEIAESYSFDGAYAEGRFGAGVTIGLYELEPFSAADIAAYQSCYGSAATVSTELVDGGPGVGAGSGEAALDIEDAISLAPDANIVVYEGVNGTNTGPFDVYAQIADEDRAEVVSTSWGTCEAEIPDAQIAAESVIFEQMAAQGQTMVAAAGDDGSEDCDDPPVVKDTALAVDDPGSQPWVTSVGGTTLVTDSVPPSETVWNDGTRGGSGGGGVSAVWGMPSWQTGPGVDNAYSATTACSGVGEGVPNSGSSCREVPDVSASANPEEGYPIIYEGSWILVGGTSAAAPLWAAVFAITDSGCFTPGSGVSKVVGLANPKLYALGSSTDAPFNDVTSGNNDMTGTHDGAYPATAHYDMASGWGTPIVSRLVADLQPSGGCPSLVSVAPNVGSAAGGTTVTISGADLATATAVHFGVTAATGLSYNSTTGTLQVTAPAGSAGTTTVTVTTTNGTSGVDPNTVFTYQGSSSPVVSASASDGYWVASSTGGVFTYGDAGFYGSEGAARLNKPVVGMAATPDGRGYWLVASDGGIFTFGDAGFFGSDGGGALGAPVVGMAATPDGRGYWLVASDGAAGNFGDAEGLGAYNLGGSVAVGVAT
jgi:kumamolisin